jgi:tRNA A-37 threonylcarbamoyl transferase component Bud32
MARDPRIGAVIGRCRIEAEIGRGGMGVVYRAEQLRLGRLVAVKVIAPELARDPAFRERFERESRVAASIEHPNVIPVHEAGETDGELYITMRYVQGTDLRELISRSGRLEPHRAASLVAQVGAALDAAHAHGLVHRDVKPGNVLVAGMGERDHAYLTDFGLTKRLLSEAGLTRTGEWVGTADYVAPEQIEGKAVDARTDVYALCCVLHQTLTGQVPYVRDSDVAKMYAHLHEPPPAVTAIAPDVPAGFDAVVARGMAKDPAERYPSAGDLGRAAVAAAEGRVADAPERSVARGEALPVTVRAAQPPTRHAAPTPGGTTRADAEPPAPTPVPASDPTAVIPPRRRLRGIGAALAALAGAGILAAALFAAGVFESEEPRGGDTAENVRKQGAVPTTPEPEPRTEPEPEPPGGDGRPEAPRAEPAATYTGGSYTARYPDGWRIAEDDVLKTTYSRTKFVSPGGAQSVLIDHSPGADNPASESAAAVESQLSQSENYVRHSFEETTVGGRPAVEWTFEIDDERKIDIFLTAGGDGYAVLGEGADFQTVIGITRDVAASIQPTG